MKGLLVASALLVTTLECAVPSSRLERRDHPTGLDPRPSGTLVDIGGQRLHMYCAGHGSPTVLLEAGAGEFSVIWSLVQPNVARFTSVCSYDRGGYAWSDPGTRPRTYWQLALELRTAARRLGLTPPYVLVGQSYGGLVVRGFAEHYRSDVAGMVLVDAVHEDERVVVDGQPMRIRDGSRRRKYPRPRIALDVGLLRTLHDSAWRPNDQPLDPELALLPQEAQRVWKWAAASPVYQAERRAEMDWSPEELTRLHQQRIANRASLGDLPLLVLARSEGGYPDGMQISADSLDRERVALQLDLARLSSQGRLIVAGHAGRDIQLDEPSLVVRSIHDIVDRARARGRVPAAPATE